MVPGRNNYATGSLPSHQDSILNHFPYQEMREVQRQALLEIESHWGAADVLVICAPTATGKSALAKTILSWQGTGVYLAPTNMLVHQFLEEFPETRSLHRMDSYQCTTSVHRSCAAVRGHNGGYCRGCPAGADISHALYRSGPLACNYHTYLAQKIERSLVVVDEAHNLIPFISNQSSIRQWKHRPPRYPSSDPATLRRWIAGMRPAQQKGKFISQLDGALNSDFPQFVLEEKWEEWRGGGQQNAVGETTGRGNAVELPCLRLTPTDIRDLPAIERTLPRGRKLVLLSATICQKDIEQLGLNRRKVVYINCRSPIPVERRPVLFFRDTPVVSRASLRSATLELGKWVEEELLSHKRGEKGLIHCTYQQSEILRAELKDPRFIFHGRDPTDKARQYAAFRDSRPADGKVLVACGMHEGLDLPDDYGRFQIVLKVPWKSLGDRAVAARAEADPDWFSWEAIKTLVQACGRICRNEKDRGETIIADGAFNRILDSASHLIPGWFRESLIIE